jgi:glycosyltransferase involved in cell wall biosynthesis
MKLLFVANRIPYPPYRGDKLKIYHLGKCLSANNEVHLVAFLENKKDITYKAELEKIFASVTLIALPKWKSYWNVICSLFSNLPLQVAYFKSNKMTAAIQQLLTLENFDAVHIQHIRMAPYGLAINVKNKILDLPDAYSLYWDRRFKNATNFIEKFINKVERNRLWNYEHKVLQQFPKVLVCSSEDARYLELEHPLSSVSILPNGVDIEAFNGVQHDYDNNSVMLFTGNMDYAPNIDAVNYFVAEILPIIQVQFPTIKFIIAGQRPVKSVLALANDHVVVTGFVKDFPSVYRSASIVVAPLRFGAGTQNKVLEAMSMGVPVVCTHVGFQGLGVACGDGVYMEINKDAFANRIIALLGSSEIRKTVGKKGMQVVQTKFDWNKVAQQLNDYLTSLN